MKRIDLNCDMGEIHPLTGDNFDVDIMPYITSCNISCGFHSGSPELIERTIRTAVSQNKSIGAHPSYHDKVNFGRKKLTVPLDQLKAQVRYQISAVKGMTESLGGTLKHVKYHGALYHQMTCDEELATELITLVKEIDSRLKIFGMANSIVEIVCAQNEMTFVSEVFADRTYNNGYQLNDRNIKNAVIEEVHLIKIQIDNFIQGHIIDSSQRRHNVKAQSICLHSDTPGAIKLSEEIFKHLKSKNIEILSV